MPPLQDTGYCDGCKVSGQDAGVHIQRCSKCQIAQYCSKACQTKMWKLRHKYECRKPEELVSHLATPQMSSSSMNSIPDVFYYTRVARPYIKDISIHGPFHLLQDAILRIYDDFRFSKSGRDCLENLCREKRIGKLVHIKAPLDADTNKFILAEILTERNAKIQAALPCPVYHVISSGILQVGRFNKLGVTKYESMDSVGTYLTKQEATEASRLEVEHRANEEPDTESISEVVGGEFIGGLTRNDVMVRSVSIFHVNGEEVSNGLASKLFPRGWFAH